MATVPEGAARVGSDKCFGSRAGPACRAGPGGRLEWHGQRMRCPWPSLTGNEDIATRNSDLRTFGRRSRPADGTYPCRSPEKIARPHTTDERDGGFGVKLSRNAESFSQGGTDKSFFCRCGDEEHAQKQTCACHPGYLPTACIIMRSHLVVCCLLSVVVGTMPSVSTFDFRFFDSQLSAFSFRWIASQRLGDAVELRLDRCIDGAAAPLDTAAARRDLGFLDHPHL